MLVDRGSVSEGAGFHPGVALLTGGGDRHYALGLALSLIAEGVALDFVGSDQLEAPELTQGPFVRFLNLRGDTLPERSCIKRVRRVVAYYVRLLRYAAKSTASVFHILWNNKFEYFDRTLLLLYYLVLGKRLVLTVHNVNAGIRDGNDGILNRLTLRIQYWLVHHLFVHTQRMKRELETGFGVSPEKISVVPFGINTMVPDTALTRDEARRHLGLHDSERVVLFFGNIAPYKGVEHLIDAMAQLAGTVPQCRLIIAGRPKGAAGYWPALQARIAALDLGSRIIQRVEYVPDEDAEQFFKAADVLALPYTHVFQSGVLFLGYSFGLPAVVADVGALREDVIEGVTGFVCDPGNSGALARALERYFSSDLYAHLSSSRTRIREFVEERHSWAAVAASTTAVYGALSAHARTAAR